MRWEIDPMFDPLQELQDCKEHIEHLEGLVRALIKAHNDQDSLMMQLSRQHGDIVKMIGDAHLGIIHLNEELDCLKHTK